MLRQLSSCRGRPRRLILVRELSRLRLSDDLTAHVVRLPRAYPVPDGAAMALTFKRLRIMPGFCNSFSTFAALNRAIFSG